MKNKTFKLSEVRWIYDENGTFIYPHIIDEHENVVNILNNETFHVENSYYAGNILNTIVNNNELAKSLGNKDSDWHYSTTIGLMIRFEKMRPIPVKIAYAIAGNEIGREGVIHACGESADREKIGVLATKLASAIQYDKIMTERMKEKREAKNKSKLEKISKVINSKHNSREGM